MWEVIFSKTSIYATDGSSGGRTSWLTSSPSTPALSHTPPRGSLMPPSAPATVPGANPQASTSRPLFNPSPCLSQNHFHETAFPSGSHFLELSVEVVPLGRAGLLPKDLDSAHSRPQQSLHRQESEGPWAPVSSTLEAVSWSATTYCMALGCAISSQSCGGPSCQERDT